MKLKPMCAAIACVAGTLFAMAAIDQMVPLTERPDRVVAGLYAGLPGTPTAQVSFK